MNVSRKVIYGLYAPKIFADSNNTHFIPVNTFFREGVRRMHQTLSGVQYTQKKRLKTPDLEKCLSV
jgi:hypothetical protein